MSQKLAIPKENLDCFITSHTKKVNSRWIKNITVKKNTFQFFKRIYRKIFYSFKVEKISLKAYITISKKDIISFVKQEIKLHYKVSERNLKYKRKTKKIYLQHI